MEWLINNPVVVVAIIAIITVAFKVISWIVSVDQGQASLKTSADSDRSALRDFMKEIREDIKKIFHRLPTPAVAGSSPLRLTDFGQEIADNFGAVEWAKGLAPKLVDEVQGKEPFEIDARCGEYVNDNWPTAFWRRKVQKCSYEMGTAENSVLNVLKVVLRDELLKLLEGEPPAP